MLTRTLTILAIALLAMLPLPALADDWVAVKLRGAVLQLVNGDWTRLQRGDVVSDDRVVRTLGNGRVDFQRDAEVISLGGSTQIRIHDRAGKRFTTVEQSFGTVEVEAEVQNVQHFAVETPYLAAAVKGTHFIVTSGDRKASVQVTRGRVEVTDIATGARALVPAGQTATVAKGGGLALKGRGGRTASINEAGGKQARTSTSSAGGNGGTAGISVAGLSASVGTGDGGVSIDVGVGNTSVDVSVGGGDGVSVSVGGTTISLGLGGLL